MLQGSLRLAYGLFLVSAVVVVAGIVHAFVRGGRLGLGLVAIGLVFMAIAVLFPRLKGPFRLTGSGQGPTASGRPFEPSGTG
jgi:hypothetical protein